MMNKILGMIVISVALTGCSLTDNYTCGQFPDSGCQPVSDVYSKTNDGLNDYRSTLFDDTTKKTEAVSSSGNESPSLNVIDSLEDRAILSKPVVMRTLINSYQDKDKDLNAGGYIYLIIKESQWVVSDELL